MGVFGIHWRAISQEVLMNLICNMSLNITLYIFKITHNTDISPMSQGVITYTFQDKSQNNSFTDR